LATLFVFNDLAGFVFPTVFLMAGFAIPPPFAGGTPGLPWWEASTRNQGVFASGGVSCFLSIRGFRVVGVIPRSVSGNTGKRRASGVSPKGASREVAQLASLAKHYVKSRNIFLD